MKSRAPDTSRSATGRLIGVRFWPNVRGMRHTIEFDRENQWAIIRYHGVVALDDALVLMRRLVTMPGWTPHCDRIVVYNDGLLGDVSPDDFRRLRDELVALLREHYGDTPTYSAQVCSNPMQRPLVEYWISFGGQFYPAELPVFDTVEAAKAWLRAKRGRD
ncbi:hypothetical protein [Maricaulis sp.]|uniref:hypothetical protein n=1 Tax=Maricaulis sp. TaxID=1486257 RepID=UPI0026391A6E|nr:hypothetical protein [Maricaulis sp.]